MPRCRVRPIRALTFSLAALLIIQTSAAAQESAPPPPASGSRYINPPGLTRPSGYTHVVVSSDGRTVYIAGQVAFDSAGQVVGLGDFRAQAAQVFSNLGRALASVGATFGDVMKTTTYITDVRNLGMLRDARGRYFDPARAPANTLIPVNTLARPELLLEIEAVAEIRPAPR
ncbi:MAG: RidA family protein [Gemmatimonadales bacterium]